MRRIHEVLLRAEQERNGGQVQNGTSLSRGPALLRLIKENSGPANTPEASTRTGVVIPPPSGAYLRFDSVVAQCAHPQWHPEPDASVFLNSTAGTQGAEHFRTLRSRLCKIRGNQPTYRLLVTSS